MLVVGILAASFGGGAVAQWLLPGTSSAATVLPTVRFGDDDDHLHIDMTVKHDRNGRQQVVTAEQFRMVDPRGNVRAVLGMGVHGPGLGLLDGDGKTTWRAPKR